MEKLLIVDGNSILNRGFYGISGSNLMKTQDGVYTNAIYGFLAILLKVLNEEKPENICVSFDLRAPTFRHLKYEQYKANRKGMPDELAMQMPFMKDILHAMNVCIIEKEGYEADDIIGTVAKMMKDKMQVLILTGDRDSFQLVEDNINIRLPHTIKGQTTVEIIDPQALKEKYGLEPLQMIELKALMGDSSDNIPGVPGVGEKTALTLIQNYGSIEKLYEFIENNPEQKDVKGKLLERLIENKELAFLSKELGTIMINAPIECTSELIKNKGYNNDELYALLKRLELKTFIQRFGLENTNEVSEMKVEGTKVEDIKYVSIQNEKEIEEIVNKVKSEKEFVYYFSDASSYMIDEIDEMNIYVDKVVYSIKKDVLSKEVFIQFFKNIFESIEIKKICFDAKKDYIMLNSIGIKYNSIYFDGLIATYILDSARNSYILSEIIEQNIGLTLKEVKAKEKQITFDLGMNAEEKDDDEAEKMNEENRKAICYGIYMLKDILLNKLKENNQLELFNNIEMKLITVLADMEIDGVEIDASVISSLGIEINDNVVQLKKEIFELVGEEFNIDSPKQLGVILFEKLKLPVIKKNKTGYSTDVDVLEKLVDDHPVIEKILEYRKYIKLKTTYIDGMSQYIVNNRIHSKLNQTVTATGRLSSTEPNLQNIPVRTEYGKNLRKIFVAKDGCVLVDADYSQIELRVLAHIASDEVMINSFNNGIDIHTTTAMQVFDLKAEEVTPKDRSAAKAVNFGIVYGISDYGLAQNINKPVKEAKRYIERYLERYSGIKQYMADIIEVAKQQGYVETMFNRRRYISEITSSNFNIRQFGERVAMNTPIQGTAADIIKIAMINVHDKLIQNNLKSRLILQIHDELIIETYIEELDAVKELLKTEMENAVKLKVPLKVEVESGKSWYDTK